MVSRKGSFTKGSLGQSSSETDTAIQLAISYIREFSTQVSHFRNQPSEEALVLLNRSASLLSSTVQPQHFNPAQLEISKFFIDLHAVLGAETLIVDSDAFWACISLLQHCSRNLEARSAIVEEFRFVPLLTHVLRRTQALERVERLLTLLQDLTFGIRISWEEPYLVVLLEQLVAFIYNAADTGDDTNAMLALSIIINLCYKNFVVMFLFLRSVHISSFSRRIQDYGMLANKMLIILSEDVHTPEQKELQHFLRSNFASIGDCLKNLNVTQLQHIVDFLLDSQAHTGLHLAMLNYTHYCEDIERLLDQIDALFDANDSSEERRKHQEMCLSMFFQLIRYILELSVIPEADGSDNVISLDAIVPRIFELLCNHLESKVCGVNAVKLLEALITLAKKESISPRIARDPSILTQLVGISENTETTAHHTAAILQLFLSLLHQLKTEKVILSKITESYFDKIFAPLLAHKPEIPFNNISLAEIQKSIFCLLLLINFADIAKTAYLEKCCSLLQMHEIQYALARALVSGNETVCRAVFQISQFEGFPQAKVAKYISELNKSCITTRTAAVNGNQWYNLNAILKSHKMFASKELEERLSVLIDAISNAQRNNQLNNVATSQMIELFNYKIEKSNSAESSMHKRLEDASSEITNLTQRINQQNAELQKYHTMNFELHISQESLQTQCKDLKQQKDNLKRNMTDLMKKLSEQSESLQINEKRLTVKISEMIVLQKEHREVQEQLQIKSEELDKLQAISRESITRIEKLKKSIAAFETEIKEKQHTIEEKERELAKTHKALDEQREAKKKADGVIAVLETQLQEKNEQIRSYESELSETEELRKTIISLMESKKPKRK